MKDVAGEQYLTHEEDNRILLERCHVTSCSEWQKKYEEYEGRNYDE
jgi:hypothetical protein